MLDMVTLRLHHKYGRDIDGFGSENDAENEGEWGNPRAAKISREDCATNALKRGMTLVFGLVRSIKTESAARRFIGLINLFS